MRRLQPIWLLLARKRPVLATGDYREERAGREKVIFSHRLTFEERTDGRLEIEEAIWYMHTQKDSSKQGSCHPSLTPAYLLRVYAITVVEKIRFGKDRLMKLITEQVGKLKRGPSYSTPRLR